MGRTLSVLLFTLLVMGGCASSSSLPVTGIPTNPSPVPSPTPSGRGQGVLPATPTPYTRVSRTPDLIFSTTDARVTPSPTAVRTADVAQPSAVQEMTFSDYNVVAPP